MKSCSIWNSLPQQDKESKVKCLKHPFGTDHNTFDCTIKGRACKNCEKDSHNFLLCPAKKTMTDLNVARNKPASSFAGQLKKSSALLKAQFVTSIQGFKIGTLLDLGSTDNYVTYNFDKRYNLHSKDINLEIEGIGGKKL